MKAHSSYTQKVIDEWFQFKITKRSITQQLLATATNWPTVMANAFGSILFPVNDDVSIIKVSPFPMATTPQSRRIGVLHEVHPCRGLVINFPDNEEPISSDDDEE
uniref:Uncharacterized protein n=1 Tax=Romanomermis culicivorax TaxID=13658 RepID=A0A915I0Y1_ROMCU